MSKLLFTCKNFKLIERTMKKLLLTLAAASVVLVACNKEEAVVPTSTSPAKKATISGKLYANTNVNNDTTGFVRDKENAPDGIAVVATVTIGGSEYRYETTSSGGSYKLEIPCGNETRTVTIMYSDFTADQTLATGSNPSTKSLVWTAGDESVDVVGGVSKIIDVEYTGN